MQSYLIRLAFAPLRTLIFKTRLQNIVKMTFHPQSFLIGLHMEFTFSLTEISETAGKLFEAAKDKKVWAFYGQMGAGKTTFIHALCELLGVTSSTSSPTYSIINEYESTISGKIYHMDWYRIKDEEEAIQAGVEDCLFSGKLCLIEWPERAEGLLPFDTLSVKIEVLDEIKRKLSF